MFTTIVSVASSREYHAVLWGRYLSRVSLVVQKVRGSAHPRFVPVFSPAPQSRPAPHFVFVPTHDMIRTDSQHDSNTLIHCLIHWCRLTVMIFTMLQDLPTVTQVFAIF